MKRLVFMLLGLLVYSSGYAKRISEQDAYNAARQFMAGKSIKAKPQLVKGAKGEPKLRNYYLFNIENNGGFVIVSGDDRTRSILGYADKGEIIADELPCNVKWLLDYYDKEISTLPDSEESFPSEFPAKVAENRYEIPMLIETQWGQGEPYNLNCPSHQGIRCATGCVATAMAQVINYHRWPQEKTSEVAGYTTATHKINMTGLPQKKFDWNNMGSSAIAQLMLYCGQSVQMDYDPYGSAAYAAMVPDALSNVFGFSKSVTYMARRDYSDDEWDYLVFNDLSQGLPVLYFGHSSNDGHAFIVDGYFDGMYHINWGWEGSCDGYFTLDRLNPFSDSGFNSSQEMIINACSPAGSSEINRPKAIIKELSCNERNLERPNVNSAFPAFNLNASIESDVASNISLQLGIALYDDNGIVKMLSQTSHGFSPNEIFSFESEITLTSDIKQGEYRIVSVSRSNDNDEWIPNIGSTTVYVRVNIEDKNARLQPMPLSAEEKYLIEYGTHTIDGITYRLYSLYGNPRADILPPNDTEMYSGDIYIPDYVMYQNMRFKLYACQYPLFDHNDNITSLSIPHLVTGYTIFSCPNLQVIEFREGILTSMSIWFCPMLKEIIFPSTCNEIREIHGCENISTLSFKNPSYMQIYQSWDDGRLWPIEDLPSLTDVYFAGDIPPVFDQYYPPVIPNKGIRIHIPQGSLEAYNCTEWKEWTLIDDQPALPVNVKWDYCGDFCPLMDGIIVGCGKNDMEFAMRIPAEHISPYKDCKITAIEYCTGSVAMNDFQLENIEYVFLTSPGIDYITKESAKTIRGTWMHVELSNPYTITGEDLFVGVGRHSSLAINWTSEETVDDGMWARNMGEDTNPLLFAQPGTWVKNLGNPNWSRPLSIRAIIEGENLPEDILVLGAEVTSQDKPQNCASDSNPKLSQISINSLKSDDKYFVEELNFAREENSTNKIDLDESAKPKRISENNGKLKIRVRNRCSHVVKNITFDWSIDGEIQQPITVETGIPKNFEDYLHIDLPKDLLGRYHTIKVDVSDIDGKPDEVKANSVIEESIVVAPSIYFPRKTVMEEATGTWCGYCPSGMETIKRMKELYPDNFIAIAVHDDEMTPPDKSYSKFLKSVYSFPNSLINRISWRDLYPFDLDETKDNGEALIKASASFGDGRNVNVSTETIFGFSDKGTDNYRIAYVVLEDNVGPYLQTNYYSNPDSEDNPDDLLNWWVHQNQYVLTTFNDVARGIYDYDGIKGLFPENIVEGDSYKSEYSLSLPYNIQDAANLKIVTLLIDAKTGEIMNADCTIISGEVPNLIVLGDTNGNGEVNIADAVNIANYVVGKKVDNFVIEAADVNEDGKITFSDASATVTMILNQPSASPEDKKFRSAIRHNEDNNDALVVDNYSTSAGSQTLSIALDNSNEYVALQADIKLPDGMSLSDIRIGDIAENTHSLMTRNIDEHNIRVVLFNLENIPFSSDGNNIIELAVYVNSECTGDIELSNIIASDAHAHEYDLASIGGHNGGISGSAVLADASDSLALGKGVINISNASGKHIAVSTADGKIVSSFDAHSDFESVSVASGIYLVRVGNRTHKVIIK